MAALQEKRRKLKKKSVDLAFLDDYMCKYSRHIYEKTGLKVQDPGIGVGCGTYGCVYLTDDPKWVVKVTRDKDEGPMALRIVEIRKELEGGDGYGPSKALPGIIFFRNIFQARTIEHHRKLFKPTVIIRENIEPVTNKDVEERMDWFVDKSFGSKLRPGLEIAQLWAEKFHSDEGDLAKAVVKFGEWLDRIKDEFPLVVDDMLYLMNNQDLMLADVHAFNVGYSVTDWGRGFRKPGSVIIHDLGMTPTVPKSRFRMLNPIPLRIVET